MRISISLLISLILSPLLLNLSKSEELDTPVHSILIAILVRNKAHSLPYVLGAVEQFNYPKQNISLWFAVDHSEDNSAEVVKTWIKQTSHLYQHVNYLRIDYPTGYDSQHNSVFDWPDARFEHLLKLKHQALEIGKVLLVDYVLYLDADVVLTNQNTISQLIAANVCLVAPLLTSASEPAYAANFWGKISENGTYVRSNNYFDIQKRRTVGLFPVSVVHSVFLLNVKDSCGTNFTFFPLPKSYPSGWFKDDMSLLYHSSLLANITAHILNTEEYGFFHSTDIDFFDSTLWNLDIEVGSFKHMLLEYQYVKEGMHVMQPSLSLTSFLKKEKRKFGFDQILLVNLERRFDRLERMKYVLDVLGIEFSVFTAVDGKALNQSYLNDRGIKMMPGYSDPYHKRSLTFGEVGCFLSHYTIWEKMVENNWERVLIFEDDLRFHASFEERLGLILAEADVLLPKWDLLYLGRKIMSKGEDYVTGSSHLSWPSYTYWTLSYALTLPAAKKLLAQTPFSKMIAVDEFLPIMFNKHPNDQWKSAFEPRDLLAVSAAPLLVEPTYYVGMKNYVSDTEKSGTLCPSNESHSGLYQSDVAPGVCATKP